jgi:hypothetical protein
MTDRVIYISRNCPHCKKLLLGIHKYDFLRSQFQIIDVATQRYPDYIDTVPTLVANQQMIKSDDVFGYMNNMVEQIFQQNPQLKQKYHPQQVPKQQQQGSMGQGSMGQAPIGQTPQKITGPDHDPVDDIIGWCPDGGCEFSPISEDNDDCSKRSVTLDDTRFSFISDSDDKLSQNNVTSIPMQQNNDQFQSSAKQVKMDQSYERLMAERKLLQ